MVIREIRPQLAAVPLAWGSPEAWAVLGWMWVGMVVWVGVVGVEQGGLSSWSQLISPGKGAGLRSILLCP